MTDEWRRVLWREMIHSQAAKPILFDVDRTVEIREEDQGVSVHRQRDEQGRLEQAWKALKKLRCRAVLSHAHVAREKKVRGACTTAW